MADQRRSDTALFATVAYKLAGLRADDIELFRSRLGLDIGRAAVEHATSAHPAMRRASRPPAVRKWMLVDERRLGVFPAAIELAPATTDPDAEDALSLFEAVQKVRGVRQVLLPESRHVVVAIVLYVDVHDADRIRAEFERFGRVRRWDVLRGETWEPAAATWAHLTQERARREGFLS